MTSGWYFSLGIDLEQVCELFDRDLQILDDPTQRLALQFSLVHRYHHAALITRAHVNRMTASLASKLKTQSLSHASSSFAVVAGNFGVTPESQSV